MGGIVFGVEIFFGFVVGAALLLAAIHAAFGVRRHFSVYGRAWTAALLVLVVIACGVAFVWAEPRLSVKLIALAAVSYALATGWAIVAAPGAPGYRLQCWLQRRFR